MDKSIRYKALVAGNYSDNGCGDIFLLSSPFIHILVIIHYCCPVKLQNDLGYGFLSPNYMA
jgi:hypothetical protein